MTLEWVGCIPGKRESRRFEGDYMLIQQDVIEQRHHEDAVSYGGWSIDLHPAAGVFGEESACNQWHAKGYIRFLTVVFIAGELRIFFLQEELLVYRMLLSVQPV